MVDEGQQELRELQEERFNLGELLKHPGYKWLMEVAASQVEMRKQQVFLRPLKAMDEILEQEYQKGEISGIELFRQLVQVRMTELTEEINRRTDNVDEE